MDEYIGLDVSLKDTAVSIRRGGKRIWRGKCASDPQLLAALIRKHAPAAKRVVFETGPLSVWFFHALTAEGVPAICTDARHAKAALDMTANKTDANDADGLAHLAEVGFYKEVRVKSFDNMLARTLADEDVWPHRSGCHGHQVRAQGGRAAHRQRRTGPDHSATARGMACSTTSRCGARTQAAGRRTTQRGLPVAYDYSRGRRRNCDFLHYRDRGPDELQTFTIGRCLGGSDDAALPVWRDRL
ncbi:hypothetical protein FHT02_001176 [Sphingomonas xinjiangensis]|uniref:Transposase IS110-like N-terminal domain-containing protein n=1 Tax=Sphingomonas xinjiangensis TaxID=643568 RepID=A0A840YGM8_9SPHN|nr:hypothetical protein [Sphingomonas xinjiangensis]